MGSINKKTLRSDFDVYCIQFLKDRRNRQGVFLPNLKEVKSYKMFSNKKYRKTAIPKGSRFGGWQQILLDEQVCRCCYCMRNLSDNNFSVEHIVPKSFEGLNETDEFDFYCKMSSEINSHVVLGSVFDSSAKNVDLDNLVKYPHTIAHSNLIITCRDNGPGCSCNYDRGNKRILPFMLMDDADSWLKYTELGELKLSYQDVDVSFNTLYHLNINTETLQQIRHLWYLFSRIKIRPNTSNTLSFQQKEDFLKSAFCKNDFMDVDVSYQKYLTNTYYWDLFLQYNWFYDYYSKTFPLN